ncbi:MAG: hypothetical protein ABSD58_02415 [Verrucomicrobiia bacterium]|jgi:hypothetical protein
MSDTSNTGAAPASASPELPQEIKTVFNKSTSFRVIYADGVWFEGDQNGNLRLIFFNERGVLPKAIFTKPVPQGNMVALKETKRAVDGQIDREIECEIVMTFATASQLRGGLHANLENLKKAMEGTLSPELVKSMKDEAERLTKGTVSNK